MKIPVSVVLKVAAAVLLVVADHAKDFDIVKRSDDNNIDSND